MRGYSFLIFLVMGLNSLAYGFLNGIQSYKDQTLTINPIPFTWKNIMFLLLICVVTELIFLWIDKKIGDNYD